MKASNNQKLFIGIDLGGKKKATTGLCVLQFIDGELHFFQESCEACRDIKSSDIFKTIKPHLKKTEVIAVDGPLTLGKGKGLMRLYEKFLSTRIFRQEKVTPLPPALMPELSSEGRELTEKLKKHGFVLDKNLIETFTIFVEKICPDDFSLQFFLNKNLKIKMPCRASGHQKSALTCAVIAFLHSQFKTRWLGYKDGFLFFPEMSFWKPEWRQKFYQAWMQRERLKYYHLITNIFNR